MPLSRLQQEVLAVIAQNRDPESYVVGGTALNRAGLRFSDDIDIFHDALDRVADAAAQDAQALTHNGFAVRWLRQAQGFHAAEISKGDGRTKLEWAHDSDFRFFPAQKDDLFGYVLHPVDLATNKVSAAAGRHVVRDAVDLKTLHETVLPLGAAALATVGKTAGWTPEGLLAEISRNLSSFTAADYASLATTAPIDPKAFVHEMRNILADANTFVRSVPPGVEGVLFLEQGVPVQPNPSHLERYARHEGQRRGHWPTSAEISGAMAERYGKDGSAG